MRILLSRTDRVGDLILSTPAIASLRRSFPEAHITLVCSRYNAVVVERNRDIDALEIVPAGTEPPAFGRAFRGKADVAIALAPRTADIALVGATRARRRIGYTYVSRWSARLGARRHLTDVLISEADPRLADRRDPYPVRHEVLQVLGLAERAGARRLVYDLTLPVTEADRERVSAIPSGGVVVHIGQRWMQEGSTLASLVALLGELRVLGRPIVVTYGDDAASVIPAIEAGAVADHVAGQLPFAAWAALFEKSACVVTVDTGATHVASAMRRPTVVLFEHRYFRLNSQEWSPWGVPYALVRKPPNEEPSALAAERAEIVEGVRRLIEFPLACG
ncbi:MAG: glycosyltransferase family 9 protein [Candidatus Eremiobacteraeota bacterium]|nr:glycosyltransferase family 9 protein [Candidatus Eremiobacteraeota bacterium]MBV8354580.1 glycosyltransferase family 9 protein [Candidatus Eremiobacteraeota bacterium]